MAQRKQYLGRCRCPQYGRQRKHEDEFTSGNGHAGAMPTSKKSRRGTFGDVLAEALGK